MLVVDVHPAAATAPDLDRLCRLPGPASVLVVGHELDDPVLVVLGTVDGVEL